MSLDSRVRNAAARLPWRSVRELGWVLAGQAVATAGSVGLTKVIASRLGAEQYGRYALGLTVAVLLNQFLLGPITTSALRFFSSYRDSGQLQAFLASLRRIMTRVAVGVVLAAIPAVAFVASRYSVDWAVLAALAAAFGLAQNTFGLANNLDIAARHRARAAIFQAADPVLRLLLAAVILTAFAPSATVAMVAVAAGITITCALQWWTLSRGLASDPAAAPGARPSPAEISAAMAAVLRFARYFMVSGAFTWLQLSSDRWAVKLFLSDAAVGLFAVAYQMASVPGVILAGCLSQFVSPIVFQRAKEGTSRSALDHARRAMFVGVAALIALTVASTAVAFLFGEPLIVLFTSPAYRAGGAYVAPLVLGLGLLQIGHMLSLVPMSSNRLGGHLIVKIAHASLAVVLNALAVRAYGLPGLCVAAIASGAVYVALVLANNHRIMRTLTPDVVPALPKPLLQP